jgi:hypothetical protein
MSMSSWAMRCASVRSPPAVARIETIESDTPRRTTAEALLDSFLARCPLAMPDASP